MRSQMLTKSIGHKKTYYKLINNNPPDMSHVLLYNSSLFYVHKQKEQRNEILDTRVVAWKLVRTCRSQRCRVLLRENENTVVSKNACVSELVKTIY